MTFIIDLRFTSFIVGESDFYLANSGTLTVIRSQDFKVVQFHLPQHFFTGGAFWLVHNGVIYASTQADPDAGILTINTKALFQRAQLDLEVNPVIQTVGDSVIWLGQNIAWYNMNTRQYHTLDWTTRRQVNPIPVVGRFAIVASGADLATNEASNALDIFDTETQTWSAYTMPYAFRGARAFAFGDEAFFFAQQRLFIFNPYNHTWRDFPMVVALQYHVVHNRLMATYFNSINELDLATGELLRTFHSHTNLRVTLGSLFVATDLFGNVTIYDVANGSFTRHQLPPRRDGVATTASNRFIFFAGGIDLQQRRLARVDIFDTLTFEWQEIYLPEYARGSDPLITDVHGHVIFVRQRRVEQLNLATMQLSEIVLELDDVTGVFARGSKLVFVSANSVTIYETSTREYFTTRFDPTFSIQDPSDNFVIATFEGALEYRQLSTMTGVINDHAIFEGESSVFNTSTSGPYATVRWFQNGEEISDQNGKFSLERSNATRADDGTYRIEVQDFCNQRMQQQALLTVHGRPVFTEALRDTINLCDEPAVIGTHVTGKNITLEWRINDQIQPAAVENITIATNRFQCDTSHSLCLTATNPSGINTTCASLRLVKLDSLIRGPRPTVSRQTWLLETDVDLRVEILDSDCTVHSWFINNQPASHEHVNIAAASSTLRVNISALTTHQEFTVVTHCGNSDVRSRAYVFENVSTLNQGLLALVIILAVRVSLQLQSLQLLSAEDWRRVKPQKSSYKIS